MEREAPPPADPRRQFTLLLLALFLLLVQFPVVLGTFTPRSPTAFDYQVLAFPSDIALVALLVLGGPEVLRQLRDRRMGWGSAAALALLVVLALAFLAHPSGRGVQTLFRWSGVVVSASVVRSLRDRTERLLVFGAVGAWAVIQCAMAVYQRATGHDIGLQRLGEFPVPFYRFGAALAPQGTMVHPYLLAGLALLAGTLLAGIAVSERSPWWTAACAIAVAPVAFTYSRAAALGYVIALACVGVAALQRGGRVWLALGALVVGVAIPAAVWSNGWSQRAKDSTGASVDTGRSVLIHQSLHLIGQNPILGVGPGRYVEVLKAHHVDPKPSGGELKPVHNLPLLAAAEGGVLAGAVMVALLLAVGWQAWKAGPMAMAVYLAYLPLTLLDHFAYTFPQGLAMTGVWIGALDLAGGGVLAIRRPRAARV